MKIRRILACALALAATSVWADIEIDSQDIGPEKITQPAKRSPFSLDTHFDGVTPAKINKGFYKGDKIRYAEAEAEIGSVVYYCPRHTEGLRVAGSYAPTLLKWDCNPWFDQQHFNLAKFTLSGFTKRMDNWFWRAQLTANFDSEKWSCKYTSYDIILWGRYEISKTIGLHIGIFSQAGLKMNRALPIIGFDWQITRKLKLSLVFPMNISCLYAIDKKWSVGAAGRFFCPRFRVHHQDQSLKPLVRYINAGGEFIVQYETDSMTANAHVGSTFGGIVRVANSNNKHARHYHLDSSLYGGAAVNLKF